jgi:hypothetical protein
VNFDARFVDEFHEWILQNSQRKSAGLLLDAEGGAAGICGSLRVMHKQKGPEHRCPGPFFRDRAFSRAAYLIQAWKIKPAEC